MYSYLGTKDEYDDEEMYDFYDIYNENGINLRNNLVVAEFGDRVIDIIPVKKSYLNILTITLKMFI